MELDIDISLTNFPLNISLELAKSFPVEFSKSDEKAYYQDVVIRFTSKPRIVTSIETEVQNFLEYFEAYANDVKTSYGVLRLGVFYNLQETIVFPLKLSAATITMLCELNLGIDTTGYPCIEDL